jgi:DNA polymerase-3 subunit beta
MGYDCTINAGGEIEPFNLPLKAARTLIKLCSESPGSDVRFFATDRMASFECGAWTLHSKLIEAQFPPFRKFIGLDPVDPITVDRGALGRALSRLALIADRNWNGVRVTVHGDRLTVALANDKTGDAVEEIEVEYEGPDRTAGYNIAYVRDAVEHASGDEIYLCINDQMQATVRAIDDARDASLHSFAPFNLKETTYGQHA